MSTAGSTQYGSASANIPFSFGSQSPQFNATPAYNGARDFALLELLKMPRYMPGDPGLFGRAGSRMAWAGPQTGVGGFTGFTPTPPIRPPGTRITGSIMDPWYGINPNTSNGYTPPPPPPPPIPGGYPMFNPIGTGGGTPKGDPAFNIFASY